MSQKFHKRHYQKSEFDYDDPALEIKAAKEQVDRGIRKEKFLDPVSAEALELVLNQQAKLDQREW